MNKINYRNTTFYTTVGELHQLPETKFEIAVVGRSNAGKSSLINTLTRQNKLAFTSKTPGRTQCINFFQVAEDSFLVDLPGYGYAKVPEEIRTRWVKLLGDYLRYRLNLFGLVLIMDARHPLKDLDIQMIDYFSQTNKPIHIVLSKIDKLNNQEKATVLRNVQQYLKDIGYGNYSVQSFSSLKNTGVAELESKLNEWFSKVPHEESN